MPSARRAGSTPMGIPDPPSDRAHRDPWFQELDRLIAAEDAKLRADRRKPGPKPQQPQSDRRAAYLAANGREEETRNVERANGAGGGQ